MVFGLIMYVGWVRYCLFWLFPKWIVLGLRWLYRRFRMTHYSHA